MKKISLNETPANERPAVATVGFFDGVHLGHQHLIAQMVAMAREADMDSMAVTFDNHPRQVVDPSFVPQMLTAYEEKLVRLAKTGIDSCVLLHFTPELAALSARDFMQQTLRDRLNVRELLVGYDNRFGHDRSEGFDDYVRYGEEMGIEVVKSTELTVDGATVSSSAIRRMIAEGNVELASRCLGHSYTLVGRVVEGHQQGRRLGFPTANIELDDKAKMIPAPGVYAVRARVEGSMEMKRAVMNIGSRPTFGGDTLSIEVHIINYGGDLYGKHLLVSVAHRLRGEQRFESTGQLVAQMREDVRVAQKIFEEESDHE